MWAENTDKNPWSRNADYQAGKSPALNKLKVRTRLYLMVYSPPPGTSPWILSTQMDFQQSPATQQVY